MEGCRCSISVCSPSAKWCVLGLLLPSKNPNFFSNLPPPKTKLQYRLWRRSTAARPPMASTTQTPAKDRSSRPRRTHCGSYAGNSLRTADTSTLSSSSASPSTASSWLSRTRTTAATTMRGKHPLLRHFIRHERGDQPGPALDLHRRVAPQVHGVSPGATSSGLMRTGTASTSSSSWSAGSRNTPTTWARCPST